MSLNRMMSVVPVFWLLKTDDLGDVCLLDGTLFTFEKCFVSFSITASWEMGCYFKVNTVLSLGRF